MYRGVAPTNVAGGSKDKMAKSFASKVLESLNLKKSEPVLELQENTGQGRVTIEKLLKMVRDLQANYLLVVTSHADALQKLGGEYDKLATEMETLKTDLAQKNAELERFRAAGDVTQLEAAKQ